MPDIWTLDHLAIVCADLDDGCAWAEAKLGLPLGPGGKHAHFGTHNRLLGLGDIYLEVIAPDPAALQIRPRWFGLDRPALQPHLGNWICRVDDLASTLQAAPPVAGDAVEMSRGDLSWKIAVPADGSLPMAGGFPTLIEWAVGTTLPADRLADSGLRLTRLTILHPEAERLTQVLAPHLRDPRVSFVAAEVPSLSAEIMTPAGKTVSL